MKINSDSYPIGRVLITARRGMMIMSLDRNFQGIYVFENKG
jgi:hypothetical protein